LERFIQNLSQDINNRKGTVVSSLPSTPKICLKVSKLELHLVWWKKPMKTHVTDVAGEGKM
jgi:hypothetical protein